MSTSELACVYAALILHDDEQNITAEKLQTVIDAAGVKVEPYWAGLFAKLFEKVSVEDLISNVGAGGGAPVAAGGGGGGGAAAGGDAAAEEKKEEKKEEEEEEEDEDMGFSLFD